MRLSEQEQHVLNHTLTGSGRDGFVYRNRFAAGPDHADEAALTHLVNKGLMRRGRQVSGDDYCLHCTQAGADAMDLHLPDFR